MRYYHLSLDEVLGLTIPQYVWLCEEVRPDGGE